LHLKSGIYKSNVFRFEFKFRYIFLDFFYKFYFGDLDNYPPKKVHGFPTRDDLERYSYIRKARKSLTGELINTKIAGRDYQIRSIRAVKLNLLNTFNQFINFPGGITLNIPAVLKRFIFF
jgi:hypothetical protein